MLTSLPSHSNPMLAGNVVALLSPLIFVPVLTFAFGPQNYDYESMLQIRRGDDRDIAEDAKIDLQLVPGAGETTESDYLAEQAKLKRASVIAKTMTAVMTVCFLVVWPMPLFGTGYIFSKGFFTAWVVVGVIWLFCSTFCVGLYPLFEGRHSMKHTFEGIVADLQGKGLRKRGRQNMIVGEAENCESGTQSPVGMEKKTGIATESKVDR